MDNKECCKMVDQENNKMKGRGKSVSKKKEKPVEKTVEFTFNAPGRRF
jgi:hypothetical protein